MTNSIHPASSGHLPSFITAPGETDVLMVVMSIILLLFVLMAGLLYFRLHALPDRFAHKKVQLEIVCVLGLIAMFTHMHIFWIAGLLLALVDLPDFGTPLKRIAQATEKLTDEKSSSAIATIQANDKGEVPPVKAERAIRRLRSV
jgi:hypothetical protein